MSSTVIARDTALAPTITKRPTRFGARRLALAGVALGILAGAAWYGHDWWTNGRFIESTDDAYVGGNVTSIAPHVAGFVAEVLVTDNQHVKAGQLLIRLDQRDFQAALDHAAAVVGARLAALQALRAQYLLQQATIRQQEADLAAKTAQATFAAQDAERYRSLAQTPAGSRQDASNEPPRWTSRRRSAGLAAAAALDAARQQLKVLDAQMQPRPPPRCPGATPTCEPPSSTLATPRSARRSTALSAIARPRLAPMCRAAPI